MGRLIGLPALAVFLVTAGCDVFLPSTGYYEQACRSDGTCAQGMTCQGGVCVRVARNWYVHPNPTAQDQDGESWLTAVTHPQDAMDLAAHGDQIWVAQGTYGRRSDSDSVLLEMRPGVVVLGGYVGGEIDILDRDPVNRRPILDCAGRCKQVVVGATQALLDGFVVRGAAASGPETPAEGSGLYAVDVGGFGVSNCTFIANAGYHGAGVTIERPVGPVDFINCLFESNVADRQGGGLYVGGCDAGQVALSSVEFRANRAIGSGGAIYVGEGCELTMANGIIWDNLASDGGGIYAQGAVVAVNSTFADNEASGSGGALYNRSSATRVVNSILYSDTAGGGGQEMYFDAGDASIVSYCLVHGGLAGGDTIIDDNPRFVSQQGGNFHLSAGSPCIEAGTNDHPDVTIPNGDFDGNGRPQGVRVDMGAFEY